MGLLLDLRSDVDDLKLVHPELHKRFVATRTAVEQQADCKPSLNNNKVVGFDSQRAASLELESLLVEIRQQPGYSRFLLPPDAEKNPKFGI